MNLKTLALLGVAAVVIFLAAMLLQPRDGYDRDAATEFFLPGLLEQAGQLIGISVVAGGEDVIGQFAKVDGRWISASPAGFPADWGNIRELIAGLAEAKISEQKTANQDYYERLGVGDVTDPETTGLRVELASETSRWVAIVGNKAASRQGQYARIPDHATSVLLDRSIELSRDPVGWLEQQFINLPAADVLAVSIQHPGETDLRIEKTVTTDSDYVLQDVPYGRQARSGFTLNGIAGGLANLEMQAAQAVETIDFTGAVSTRFESFDGRRVVVDLVQSQGQHWLRISADFVSTDEPTDEPTDDQSAAADWVDSLNTKTSRWAYAIPEYKYTTLSRKLEDLLEPAAD